MPPLRPSRAQTYPYRSLVTGLVFTCTSLGVAITVGGVLQLLFPKAFNSILFLIVALPILAFILVVSLGVGFLVARRVARRLALPHPLQITIVSVIMSAALGTLLSNLWPYLALWTFWAINAIFCVLCFIILDAFNALRWPKGVRIAGSVLIIAALVFSAVATSGQGTNQARTRGLDQIDYTIYLPSPSSGFTQPDYISPAYATAEKPMDFTEGINLEFRDNVDSKVTQSKYLGIDPREDCSPYIQPGAAEQGITETCKLIEQTGTLKIYLETKTTDDGAVNVQRYYGLTPTTFIAATLMNPNHTETDAARSIQFLKSLQPVSIKTLLERLHTANPEDF